MRDADSENPSGTDADAMKRRFRAALDRKNRKRPVSFEHKDGDSKVHGAHAAADHKREFRRKSG